MRLWLGLMVLLVTVASVPAFQGVGPKVELRTIKGDVIPGVLVDITATELIVTKGTERVATPLTQILLLDFPQEGKPAPVEKYHDVELTDGSVIHCANIAIKGKRVTLVTVGGSTFDVPLVRVSNLLMNAQDAKSRKEWTAQLGQKRSSDILAILNKGVLNALEVTLGDVSDDGKKISFRLGDSALSRDLDKVHGLIWEHAPDPAMPIATCKLIDVYGSTVMAVELGVKGSEIAVTTPLGVKLTFPFKMVAKIDYNKDKLKYLSDLDPIKLEDAGTVAGEWVRGIQKDRIIETPGGLRLGGNSYPKGLFIPANADITYDLRGDYRELKMVAGVDTSIGGQAGPVTLTIECDGREREKLTFNRKDKEPYKALTVNIKDVQKLRLIVSAGKDAVYGRHLTLADAKVTK